MGYSLDHNHHNQACWRLVAATSVLRLRQLWALLIHFGGVHESTWVSHLLVCMQPFKWAGAWVGRVKSEAIYSTTMVSPTVGLHFWFRQTSLQFRVFVRCVSLWTSLSFLFELLYFLISFTVFLLSLWIWPPVPSSFTVFPYGFRFFSCSISLYFLSGLTAFPCFLLDLATLLVSLNLCIRFAVFPCGFCFVFFDYTICVVCFLLILLHFPSSFAVFPPSFRRIALWTSPNQHPKPQLQFRRHPPPKIGFTILLVIFWRA